MKLFCTIAAGALLLWSGNAAATTITFAALPGSNGSVFTSYTESGYQIAVSSGDVFVGQSYGNPVPDLFMGPFYGSAESTLTLTALGSTFSFGGFDLSANGNDAIYTITGTLGGNTVFQYSGSDTAINFFSTIAGAAGTVDTVRLDLTATGTSLNLDNIVVNAVQSDVPEPASWAMMLAGFGAIGGAIRRRRITARVRFA